MSTTTASTLSQYLQLPRRIRAAIRGLREKDLDRRGGSEGWSVRETVHHLVEANLIAANMILAALATDGYNFDWTWVWPSAAWNKRVGYHKAPIDPAIRMLAAMGKHIEALLRANPKAITRKVLLNDTPDGPRYAKTIAEILQQEIDHVTGHLGDIREIRRTMR